jgi:hypothetical protein
MPQCLMRLALVSALVLSGPTGLSGALAAEPEQTTPQGEDPPGADNGLPSAPPAGEQDFVIPPPDIGDKDIYTDVPNPEAGHDMEVIPPPDIQIPDPNAAPR